jgi:BMFP domain-containing protein YqiC
MQTENRLFDDLTRVASGALTTLGGLRDEVEARFKERLERLANEMDLVTREEFDAVQAMATKARSEQARLEERLAALEAEIAGLRAHAAGSGAAAQAAPSSSRRAGKSASSPKDVDFGSS